MKSWIYGLATAPFAASCGMRWVGRHVVPTPGSAPPVALATAPVAPTSLSVVPDDQFNIVQWSAVATATSYTLYWSETSPLTKATANAITNVVSPFKHTGLTNGKLIYYGVTAYDAAGESELSSAVGAAPVAPGPASPASVNATAGDKMVTLAWAPVSGASSYNVYWSKASPVIPGGAGVTKIDRLTTTSYTHVGLTNGDRYYYIVTAVNSSGESAKPVEVSATPMPPAPGAPMNLAATSGDTQIQLSWSPALDATSYNVYWSKAAGVVPGGTGVTKIPGVAATSYTHTGLTNGDTYYYVVSATGMAVKVAVGREIGAATAAAAPAPLGLTAVAAKDVLEIAVQWFDVPNYPSATAPIQLGYDLYRGLQPGVATYLNDPTKVTKFANVTAPFIDTTNLATATTYYYVVTAFVPSLADVESVPSGEVSATSGRSGGGGGGGGGDEGFGTPVLPDCLRGWLWLVGPEDHWTWPEIGPFATLPTFDFNTGLRPLSPRR